MKTVICSHGFGVGADARGLFFEVASAFPEYHFVMFDYNTFDEKGNVIVASIDDQANILQKIIDENSEDSILLCHSQGSVIAGLVDLHKISKVILLAPPAIMGVNRVIEKLKKKDGSVINLEGMSQLPRSDGTITYIPKRYLDSVKGRNPIELYGGIARIKPIIIIRPLSDEILGLTNVNEVRGATLIDLEADHDFTGQSRQELIEVLGEVFTS